MRDPFASMPNAFIALVLTVILTGCGSPGAGGDTTCGDYKKLSKSEQTLVIKDFLSSKGKSEASNFEIGATRLSALAYCSTAGNDSSPIKNIDG